MKDKRSVVFFKKIMPRPYLFTKMAALEVSVLPSCLSSTPAVLDSHRLVLPGRWIDKADFEKTAKPSEIYRTLEAKASQFETDINEGKGFSSIHFLNKLNDEIAMLEEDIWSYMDDTFMMTSDDMGVDHTDIIGEGLSYLFDIHQLTRTKIKLTMSHAFLLQQEKQWDAAIECCTKSLTLMGQLFFENMTVESRKNAIFEACLLVDKIFLFLLKTKPNDHVLFLVEELFKKIPWDKSFVSSWVRLAMLQNRGVISEVHGQNEEALTWYEKSFSEANQLNQSSKGNDFTHFSLMLSHYALARYYKFENQGAQHFKYFSSILKSEKFDNFRFLSVAQDASSRICTASFRQ